jgi:hypothetical protein
LTRRIKNDKKLKGKYMDNLKKIFIKTKRLIIRNFTKGDFNNLYEYLSDKDTYKYEPGKPISINESKTLCKGRAKNNTFLAVQLKNKVIGHIYIGQIEPKK